MKRCGLLLGLIFLGLWPSSALLDEKPAPTSGSVDGPWVTTQSVEVGTNQRTTIMVASEDSSVIYTLFDNTTDRNCTVAFILQPQFWEVKAESDVPDSCLTLPLPLLPSSKYYWTITTPEGVRVDTTLILK